MKIELHHLKHINSYQFYTKYKGSYLIESKILELFEKYPTLKYLHSTGQFKLLYNLVNQLDIEIDDF
jgi:hypothetical protein